MREDELGPTGLRCVFHNGRRCCVHGCKKWGTGTMEKADGMGPPGNRCDAHGGRGQLCVVEGCSTRLVWSNSRRRDDWGPSGPRCYKHGGLTCQVKGCMYQPERRVKVRDYHGPPGLRCHRHGGWTRYWKPKYGPRRSKGMLMQATSTPEGLGIYGTHELEDLPREVARPEGLPEGWRAFEHKYKEGRLASLGKTYVRYRSPWNKCVSSTKAAIAHHAAHTGEDVSHLLLKVQPYQKFKERPSASSCKFCEESFTVVPKRWRRARVCRFCFEAQKRTNWRSDASLRKLDGTPDVRKIKIVKALSAKLKRKWLLKS